MLHKEPVDTNRQRKKVLFWVLRLLSGALILGLVLYSFNIGIGGLSSTLSSVIPYYLALAALFFFLAILTGIMAWRILLMPHGNGLELVGAASHLTPPPLILVMTGKVSSTLEQDLRLAGATRWLLKPFGMPTLMGVVDELLQQLPPSN